MFRLLPMVVLPVCVLFSTSNHATIIVDQSTGNLPELGNGGAAFVHSTATPWQTFTAGMSGALTSIDLGLSYDNLAGTPVTIDALATIRQGTTLLGSGSFNSFGLNLNTDRPVFKNVQFSNISLTAGVLYQIQLTAPTIVYPDKYFVWELAPPGTDIYTGGSGVFDEDFVFRTYMDVNNVPVPAAVWLFCSGLIGLIGAARFKLHDIRGQYTY